MATDAAKHSEGLAGVSPRRGRGACARRSVRRPAGGGPRFASPAPAPANILSHRRWRRRAAWSASCDRRYRRAIPFASGSAEPRPVENLKTVGPTVMLPCCPLQKSHKNTCVILILLKPTRRIPAGVSSRYGPVHQAVRPIRNQNSAFPGVRAKGITSRILAHAASGT